MRSYSLRTLTLTMTALALAAMVGVAAAEETAPMETIIAESLQDGLTRQEAVSVALAANSALQASFDEVGVAQDRKSVV